MKGINARSLTMRTSVLLGIGEIAQIFIIETPAPAAVMAFLFLGAAWLMRRGQFSGVYVVAILAFLELAGLPVYERKTTSDWLWQIGFGVVSAIALVSAIVVLVQKRRAGSNN